MGAAVRRGALKFPRNHPQEDKQAPPRYLSSRQQRLESWNGLTPHSLAHFRTAWPTIPGQEGGVLECPRSKPSQSKVRTAWGAYQQRVTLSVAYAGAKSALQSHPMPPRPRLHAPACEARSRLLAESDAADTICSRSKSGSRLCQ